jgi:hypothetical protein
VARLLAEQQAEFAEREERLIQIRYGDGFSSSISPTVMFSSDDST